ncbi:MAG: DUF3971 domain-containing protein [Gammaproteobacteria bacterium]|nr:DUF3971 domain-containing protein [Gammaproteobacteria bacterium]
MAIKQHKLRSRIVIAIAIVVIFFAVVFSIFRAIIPYITDYGEDIERELTAQLGMPVEIGMIDADISWLIPRLKFLDVSIYDVEHKRHFLHFSEISVSLNWTESIKNMRPELGDIFVFGMNLQIERNQKGEFLIQGININVSGSNGTDASAAEKVMNLFSDTSLYLVDSTIHWVDQINNSQRLDFTKVNLTMINNEPGHKVSIDMDLPAAYGRHVRLMAEFEGDISNPHSWLGRSYISLESVQLDAWLNDYWQFIEFPGSGQLTADAWFTFNGLSIERVSLDVQADDMVLYHLDEDVQAWRLDHFSALMKWLRTDDGMIVDIRDLEIQRNQQKWVEKSAVKLQIYEHRKVKLTTNYARLDDLVYFANIADTISTDFSFDALNIVDEHSVVGDLYDATFSIDLDRLEEIVVHAYFNNFGYKSISDLPSVQGLDGHIGLTRNHILLDIESDSVVLDFNGLFRNELNLNYLSGAVDIVRKDNDWHIDAKEILAQSPHIRTDSMFHIEIPDQGSVFMDIFTRFQQGDASYTSLYLPTSIMSKETVDWLDKAIVRGNIRKGGFLFHGKSEDFPFHSSEGVMEVLFDIDNTRLQYLPDWPAITSLKSSLLFYNSRFSIENAMGHIYGADLSNINVAIDDLADAHLSIDGDIAAPLSDLFLYVRNSPLKEALGSFISDLKGTGRSDLDLDLQIPLSNDDEVKINGQLLFKNNEILLPDQGYLLNSINGELMFTESSTHAEKIQAKMNGHALDVTVQPVKVESDVLTRIEIAGRLPVKNVLAPMPVLKEYLDGMADWGVNIDIPGTSKKDHPSAMISVKSNLQGVSFILPAPFKKTADTSVPFELNIAVLPSDILSLSMNYNKSTGLQARHEKQLWDISLQSKSLTGAIQFSAESIMKNPVILNIDYVNLSEYINEDITTTGQTIKPAELPSLTLNAKEVVWNDIGLKNISLKTHKSKSGMMIDQIRFDAPDIHLQGKGSWISTWRHSNLTSFDFKLSSNNLGNCLTNLNITRSIKDAHGEGVFKWRWPAEPYKFKWDLLEGESVLNLKDGKLIDIQPGAARILGIFNFETLLSLDFGNQVSGGFAFDDIKGNFSFSNGNAYTDNFKIEGKVAEINMKGRIGLTAEDYDQIITVTPGVSGTLSVIGTLAAGAPVGAAILLFQKVFGLDKIAEYKYSVTGSWNDPQVKVLSVPEKIKQREEASEDDF